MHSFLKKSFFLFSGVGAIATLVVLNKTVISKTEESSIFVANSLFSPALSNLEQGCLSPFIESQLEKLENLSFKRNLTSSLTFIGINSFSRLTSKCNQSSNSISSQFGQTSTDDQLNFLANNGRETTSEVPQLASWPQIHQNAKLAKIPVIMYHDIVPKKEVFFDVTPQELEADFELMRSQGITPISMDWLISHLRTGIPLPEKPIVLTFDDGYNGHYKYVYPLLRKYGYPAVFSIYVDKIGSKTGRAGITSEQLQEMAIDPLVAIAAHSTTHPDDLRDLSDDDLQKEIAQSKSFFEKKLGIPIRYFTYPAGRHDARVKQWVAAAGYRAAFSMDENEKDEHFAGESPDLLAIGRFGQSRLEEVIAQAWGGNPLPIGNDQFNFNNPITKQEVAVDGTELILITGGQPKTIHADSRYQVPEILQGTEAIAAVDGGFFSLKYLDSNVMIGPVLSQNQGFAPGNAGENPKLLGRPLILISSQWVRFIPFDPDKHNTLTGILSETPDGEIVTDAFVGAAWLVKDSIPQPAEAFGNLFDFDAARHRAFWGIDRAGQPVIGVSKDPVDSISLGQILHSLGLRDAVMLDSGASTSLAYKGESLVGYTPRPVPHVVALFAPSLATQIPISHVGLPCVLDADSCEP
jgi:peptidoglycan/xylan/chitin deacetylase (PgdA/CDA1 family)